MIGDIYSSTTPVSNYQPSKAIADFTAYVKKDFSTGVDIITKSWVELNDMSVIERDNRDQRTFNAFVDESIEDPNEAWKWRGTRSKARNKAIAMHSHLTAGYIIPMYLAQNDSDEEDRDMGDMMRDIVEWMVDNSNYKSSFLTASMGMLVNCVTYLGAEFAQVMQTITEKTEEGYTKKEIIDEVLSGFQAPVYSSKDILITNAYEQNIQRQRCLIKRRYIEFSEAKAKYGDHPNWEYVRAGWRSVYSDAQGLFYDVKDDDHPNLVEEAIYLNRREDTEVPFIGGIYMGKDDGAEKDVEYNPIRHRDNRNAPKYNIVPFGYQRINEHFFFYKSLMNAQYWDNQLLDAQYEVGMNRAFLDTNMPIAVSGVDKVDSEIIFPNAVAAFADKDTKVTPILPQANLGNMFSGMSIVEKSMDESSISDVSAGQNPDPNAKATGLAIAERNAKTMLQGVGKTLAESVVQYGGLMSDIAVQHLSIPQIEEIAGGKDKIRYKSFILKNKTVKGKSVTKQIRFDESLLGVEMTDKEKEIESLKLLEESGYPDKNIEIYRANPEVFARMKYLTRVEPERMFPENEEFMRAMYSQVYGQFQANPFVSLEALTRKTLYQFFRGETDEIMQKPEAMNPLNAVPNASKGTSMGNQAVQKGIAKAMV
jgi:hypothetical protein